MTKKLFVAISVTLFLSALAQVAPRISAKSEKTKSNKLRVSITTSYTKDKFSVLVRRFDNHPFMSVIRVPDNENGADPNKASAIKIVPYLTGNGVIKADISLLFGDVTSVTSCEQYKKLKQQSIASYDLGKGEQVTAFALKKFGLLTIEFQIDEEEEEFGNCDNGCRCGRLCCKPNAGNCLGCGGCGQCCLT